MVNSPGALCVFSPAAGFQAPDMNDFCYITYDAPPQNYFSHNESAKKKQDAYHAPVHPESPALIPDSLSIITFSFL
ncbi:hypothetical protein Pvag_pPag20108 (plasmid) [Pantoea vagans C9-1]|nr:hypothetical protein Pvag_pPag20108 [Pantoea vagans C9-1]